MDPFDVTAVRKRFSALSGDFTFMDAPGGTQVPDEVGDAVARMYREASGNAGVPYATSRRIDEVIESSPGQRPPPSWAATRTRSSSAAA